MTNKTAEPVGSTTPSSSPTEPAALAPGACEKCRQVKRKSKTYSFYYGALAGTEQIDRGKQRYHFSIAGTQKATLCDDCVADYAKKWTWRITGGITGILALLLIGILGCNLVTAGTGGGATPHLEVPLWMLIVLIVVPVVVFLVSRRQTRKQPAALGDALAMEVHRPALKAQGYTRFFTRQQVKGGRSR